MRNLRRRVLGIESSQELGYATSAERNEDRDGDSRIGGGLGA